MKNQEVHSREENILGSDGIKDSTNHLQVKPSRVCEVHWLDQMDYQIAWNLQDQLAGEISRGARPATLLLVEHTPTFTIGRSGKKGNLLWNEAEISRRGIQTYWVDRGGDITYHGPGQLVGYPLLPLAPGGLVAGISSLNKAGSGSTDRSSETLRLPRADYHSYLRQLEIMLSLTLLKLGIESQTIEGLTGVWVNLPDIEKTGTQIQAKIAAIGVKVDARGISRHGFALNVDPNMEHWQGIIPCGIKNCRVTCLRELMNPCPPMRLVRDCLLEAFAQVFNYEIKSV